MSVHGVVLAAEATLTVTATVDYTGGRHWSEHWRRVIRGREAIDAIYAGSSNLGDTDEWKAAASAFFVDVYHLAEWIAGDPGSPSTARVEAETYARTNSSLAFAAAYANTYKHHTRNKGVEAHIGSLTSGQTNAMRLDWTNLNDGTAGTRDVRHLAQECVEAWEHFFKHHSMTP